MSLESDDFYFSVLYLPINNVKQLLLFTLI